MSGKFTIRRFAPADADAVRMLIHRGLREINGKDYPEKRIEGYCDYFTVEKIGNQAETAHMYVAVSDDGSVVGTGTIAPFGGSRTESVMLTWSHSALIGETRPYLMLFLRLIFRNGEFWVKDLETRKRKVGTLMGLKNGDFLSALRCVSATS